LRVKEAREGEPILPNCVYLAPGGKHMFVRRFTNPDSKETTRVIGLNENPPENSCRPSVDVLFRSVAAQFGGNVLSLVMTGMGVDGLEGTRALKLNGAVTLTQSESSCVVFGMPMAVEEAGLSDESVPLHRLASRITDLVRSRRAH
jgi:two-component system chemotaxis response regulator CheB